MKQMTDQEIRNAEQLGQRIRAYRAINNLTQSELALKFGYKGPAVSLWESGKRRPPASLLIELFNLDMCPHCNGFGFRRLGEAK